MPESLDPRRVQQALVCMLFDPRYAATVRGRGPMGDVGQLSQAERALLRGVDPRALATDTMRRPRALQVILEEYPLSAALLGLDQVDRFFSSPVFRRCVFERGSMVVAFGVDYLGHRTLGVGTLETATARARRSARGRGRARVSSGPTTSGFVRSPGLEPVEVPAGTLAWVQLARERLGPAPLETLAQLRRPWSDRPPKKGKEQLLIEVGEDGAASVGTASAALVGLLQAAAQPCSSARLAAVAASLGAEAQEIGPLFADLVAEGLLGEL